jgi:hypothetical protein
MSGKENDAPKFDNVVLPIWLSRLVIEPEKGYSLTVLYNLNTLTEVGRVTGQDRQEISFADVDAKYLTLVSFTGEDAYKKWITATKGGGQPESGTAGNGSGRS